MDKKTMLKKLFTRYAILGANSASARGCYETPVPYDLIKNELSYVHSKKQLKSK